jgi:hypothetical protein
MTNNIAPFKKRDVAPFEKKELAFNGRSAKSSDAEIILALGPIYVAWPKFRKEKEFVNLLCLMLRDIPPDKLAAAVMTVVETSKFEPTVAHIREAYEAAQRTPGPQSEVSQEQLEKPIPTEMYRLDPEEDKRQRMERLRQTKGWGRFYA